ncbi:hypothetical protein D3C75_1367310 [compost metagenome]
MVRVKYGHKSFDNAGWGIELSAALTFSTGELAEEVFINLTQQVASLVSVATEADS